MKTKLFEKNEEKKMETISFNWKSGYWLIGLGLSGSQADYIKSRVNEFIKNALKKQREKIKGQTRP